MGPAVQAKTGRPLDLSKWAVLPALIGTTIFFVVPLGVMLLWSFWQRIGGKLDQTLTLANYEKFFGRDYMVEGLVNSIEVALTTTVGQHRDRLPAGLYYRLSGSRAVTAVRGDPRRAAVLDLLRHPFLLAWLLILSEQGHHQRRPDRARHHR